jgi:hypothetical protein
MAFLELNAYASIHARLSYIQGLYIYATLHRSQSFKSGIWTLHVLTYSLFSRASL